MSNGSARAAVLTLAVLCVSEAALAAKTQSSLVETTADQVRACKPLGEVLGVFLFCKKSSSMDKAREQAIGRGATHIVWLDSRCVPYQGMLSSALIYDCSQGTDLEEAFENYLLSDPKLAPRTLEAEAAPRVLKSADLDADAADLRRSGYALIAYAGAIGGRIPLERIRSKAAEVKAEIALLQSNYSGEDVDYKSVTSYTPGGVSVGVKSSFVVGSVGGVGMQASGVQTTVQRSPGTGQREMVPYSERRFDTQVLFWRKLRPGPLGLHLDLIPSALRSQLARNTGAFVIAVEDESPAFFANIVPGDIVISLDGREIRTPAELSNAVETLGSEAVPLQVLRNGQILEVEVKK